MNEEPKFIVSGRVGTAGGVAAGSDIVDCSQCGSPIWRSPSSKVVEQEIPGIQYLCIECASPQLEEGDICPINNAQLREVANHFGVSIEDAAEALHRLQKKLPELLRDMQDNN